MARRKLVYEGKAKILYEMHAKPHGRHFFHSSLNCLLINVSDKRIGLNSRHCHDKQDPASFFTSFFAHAIFVGSITAFFVLGMDSEKRC